MGFLGAALFGGPTAQEQSAAAQTNSMANALQGQYQTEFGQYENVAQSLQNNLSQELLQGQQGEGLTAAQMAPLQTAAINSAGQNFTNAQIAEQTREAGLGGGVAGGAGVGGNISGLQSGVESQIQGQIAAAGANALTNAQIGIANENTNVALQKQQEALGGLAGLAGGYQSGALNAAGQELSQNKNYFGQETQIQQDQEQQAAAIGSGVAALAGGVAGGVGNLDFAGTSTPFEHLGNFAQGFGA